MLLALGLPWSSFALAVELAVEEKETPLVLAVEPGFVQLYLAVELAAMPLGLAVEFATMRTRGLDQPTAKFSGGSVSADVLGSKREADKSFAEPEYGVVSKPLPLYLHLPAMIRLPGASPD